MEIQIKTLEPPIEPNPADDVKGRKSYKVTLMSGDIFYAWEDTGSKLNEGDTYDNVFVKSEYNNKYLYFKRGNDGAPNQPEPPPPVPSPTPPQPAPAPSASKAPKDPTPANIWIQGITQQAVASGIHDPAAVYQWAVDNYENFRTRKPLTAFPKRKPNGEAPF